MAERRYALSGEVDLADEPELRTKLLVLVNATNDDLVIDCDGLEFMDSTAIAVLFDIQRLLEIQDRGFRIINLTGMPRRSIDLLGLTEILGIAELDHA